MKLKPIKRSRLYESAVDQIRSLILADNYNPGDRLPSERELAEQLSVGRPSVREALRILGAMGLIEIRVGNGTYVRDVTLLPYIESPGRPYQLAPEGSRRPYPETLGCTQDPGGGERGPGLLPNDSATPG